MFMLLNVVVIIGVAKTIHFICSCVIIDYKNQKGEKIMHIFHLHHETGHFSCDKSWRIL